MGRSDRVTGPLQAVAPTGTRYRLLVLGENTITAIHVLPELGSVTIGRDATNEIQINDVSISRRHAVLHVGETIAIEDLHSSNGTKLRETRIPPRAPQPVGVNEPVTLGSVTLIVQQRFAPAQTNRIATADYFQTRLEEECARAERSGAQFAVIGVRAQDRSERVVTPALMTALRQCDVLAQLGEHAYALLATDVARGHAEEIAARLVGALEETGTAASATIAHFPSDARSAFALLARITGDDDAERKDLIIEEPSMRDLYALARRIAASDLSVLVLGETGVGKEKMARTLHESSPRAARPFVVINCAALNDALLETELFGHERGAFTGASTAKRGLLETADGGTLFLDEIGDMSLAIQAKLLRVIEDGEVRPVGAVKSKTVSVRFVAATNVDLEAAVERGSFRGDLYFRLGAATLVIPPLRERPREIVLLARWFAARAGNRIGRPNISFRPDALALLRTYSWPGNIRELRNVVERAVVMCNDDLITDEHLPVAKMRGTYLRPAQPTLNLDERARVIDALAQAEGNQSKAASLLGVSRRTLINRLEQYNLPRPRKRNDT